MGDPLVGQPLCRDCYDYIGQVLFTWYAPKLWDRFALSLRRQVARAMEAVGLDPDSVRVSYVKVVELQRRGVPHFHAIIRLDPVEEPQHEPANESLRDREPGSAATSEPDRGTAQEAGRGSAAVTGVGISAVQLAAVVHRVAAAVELTVPGLGGEALSLRFGSQVDAQPVPTVGARRVAGYLAKYVTKSVGDLGLTARRLSPGAIDTLDVNPHLRRILHTIVALSTLSEHDQMIRWLHTLGYRGHVTSKTRRYSTTMTALRARRQAWRTEQDDTQDRNRHSHTVNERDREEGGPDQPGPDQTVPEQPAVDGWVVTALGLANEADRLLARTEARKRAEERWAARETPQHRGSGDDPGGEHYVDHAWTQR